MDDLDHVTWTLLLLVNVQFIFANDIPLVGDAERTQNRCRPLKPIC
jgi:hypothetical protein